MEDLYPGFDMDMDMDMGMGMGRMEVRNDKHT
jgi:hypothetical protein